MPLFADPRRRSLLLSFVMASAATSLLAGCAGLGNSASSPVGTPAVRLAGAVHGGEQPVSGARIYLYAVGSGSYGAAASSLLTGAGVSVDPNGNGYVSTDAHGFFTITGDYTCSNQQTYLLALGGNPGLAPGTNNTALALMAALGNCSNLSASTNIFVSELSTAAAVTALQQFMTDSVHLGASSGNALGLTSAMNLVPNLVDLATSAARSTSLLGNGAVPQSKLNTLANILSACVNSTGQGSSACSSLFTAATPSGGTVPIDTLTAMLSMAQNPGSNVPALFGLIPSSAPYQPTLPAAPNDFSVGITYTGGGLTFPGAVAIDATGNAWIANCPNCVQASTGTTSTGTDSLVGFGTQGSLIAGATGITANIHKPQGLAFAPDGSLWSVNQAFGAQPDQVLRESESGGVASGFPYAANLGTPAGIAIDASSNAWVTNQSLNNAVQVITSAALGAIASSTGFQSPSGIAIDGTGILFAAGTGSSSVLKFNSTGTVLSGSGAGYTGAGLANPVGVAIDSADHVWAVDNGTNQVSKINGGSGTDATGASGYNAGLYQAAVLAIDGNGTAWIANCRSGCAGSGSPSGSPDNVIHLSAAGAQVNPSDGLQDANFSGVGTVAIDSSGNLWVTNNGGASVTELLGVAAPVKTPLAVAAAANQLGARP